MNFTLYHHSNKIDGPPIGEWDGTYCDMGYKDRPEYSLYMSEKDVWKNYCDMLCEKTEDEDDIGYIFDRWKFIFKVSVRISKLLFISSNKDLERFSRDYHCSAGMDWNRVQRDFDALYLDFEEAKLVDIVNSTDNKFVRCAAIHFSSWSTKQLVMWEGHIKECEFVENYNKK